MSHHQLYTSEGSSKERSKLYVAAVSTLRYAPRYMGSLGLEKCHWCQKEGFNYYIPDGVDEPLCEQCLWDQYYTADCEPVCEPDWEPETEPPIKKRRTDNTAPTR